ncbi:hypothetical protein HPB48_018637 [Haemaphysalis longicornis]|uniref:SKI/SNO/DAC domain-containing protein n=1 Tax=Haemaphysalis longicornis TaxID=44386 RepID=A0A9J6G5Q5_HAELO|nr:hypothetical protein HPB48_018637 [Haemaphysalis longicornis]
MASTDAAALMPENLSLGGGPPSSSYLGDSRDSSPCGGPELPPPLPPAFNAAALCDQFCSVINGFRGGLDPLSSARLKSPSRSVAADATDCRLIEYRGEKIAAFAYRGEYLLCLPQAFELFLKHLVGGLHTVYTKLKRLGISPIVCNVEQVRVLRGLGAIQPGVNRCKLLSCKDFDSLYKDCTTARSGAALRSGSFHYLSLLAPSLWLHPWSASAACFLSVRCRALLPLLSALPALVSRIFLFGVILHVCRLVDHNTARGSRPLSRRRVASKRAEDIDKERRSPRGGHDGSLPARNAARPISFARASPTGLHMFRPERMRAFKSCRVGVQLANNGVGRIVSTVTVVGADTATRRGQIEYYAGRQASNRGL